MAADKLSSIATEPSALRKLIAHNRRADKLFAIIGMLALFVGVFSLAALLVDLALDGGHRLSWQFLTSFPSRHAEKAGILSAWVGTCLVMFVTMFSAVPIGIAAGVYLEEYARRGWITDIVEVNVTNLAGVPSIVYGLLALGLFVYGLGFGQSVLSAGLTLGLLILPVVIVSTREAIRAVPVAMREAAYALGATRWQTVSDHIVPYSTGGILTGIILGLSRAIGETAPIITIGALTFIAFLPPGPVTSEPPYLSFEWLFAPFTVMPIQMFNWLSRPQVAFLDNAAAAGLILVLMTVGMNAVAIWLRYRYRKKIKW